MKFLVDENVPQTLIKELKSQGHYDKDFLDPGLDTQPVPKIIIRIPYPNLELVKKRLLAAIKQHVVQSAIVTIYPGYDDIREF